MVGIQAAIEHSHERGPTDLADLERARDCCRKKGLLPDQMPKRRRQMLQGVFVQEEVR